MGTVLASDIDVGPGFEPLGHHTPLDDRLVLCRLAREYGPREIVEVGCFVGMTTVALLRCCPEAHLHCVDHFGGNCDKLGPKNPDEVFGAFCRNTRLWTKRVTPYRATSKYAADHWVGQVDMVYLDAGHSYEDVKADIGLWAPRVRPGGILCGHDYSTEYPGVVEACQEFGIDGFEARVWWKKINGVPHNIA